MAKEEVTLQNLAGGELSANMRGRYPLAIYRNGCERVRNFIVETQGPAFYRPGFQYVHNTRLNQVANMLKFEFNDLQAYQLEFTNGYLRFYKDNSIITEASVAITGLTQADPGVVTSTGHNLENGDEVFLEAVVGMTEVNNRSFLVANKTSNTFEITDIDGTDIATTVYTAYVSGGVFKKIYEITTPYTEANDLFAISITQNADTSYIAHRFYEPRKLTRTGHTAWTLVPYARTADPFTIEKVITGITRANPGVVSITAHGFVDGDVVIIEEVVGMTEVNSQPYIVANKNDNDFELTDLAGANVDTSGFTAWSSAGFASNQNLIPRAVTFYESRLWFAGADIAPDKFYGSRSPEGSGDSNPGDPRYDDYTVGTDADHAVEFTIADAEVNNIRWLMGTDKLLFAGTFGTEVKITGETIDKAIAPDSVHVRAENRRGVAAIPPINKENIVLYVERGKRTLRSFEYDVLADSYVSIDRNLVSQDITDGLFKQMTWQSGRPDILWSVMDNGHLLGLTFKSKEDVSGWHRHTTKNGDDLFLSISTMPRPTGFDQIWAVIERTINGNTRRYVEFATDIPLYPERVDFFTGTANEAADKAKYLRAMAEKQKDYVHLDSSLTYDGTAAGTAASATMTPSAVSGDSVTFTASAAVFSATDVDREIRKKAINGVGNGRAIITGFTSTTVVTCQIVDDFDSVTAMAAGNWYLTTDSLTGLRHLEGETIQAIVDGSVHADVTVADGAVTLDYQVSKAHFGIGYTGLLKPMALEGTGVTGPSQTKNRNVYQVGVKFHQTMYCEFGTDPYEPIDFVFNETPLNVGDPTPLFTGVLKLPYTDAWEEDKNVFIRQTKAVPCTVQLIMSYMEGDNN